MAQTTGFLALWQLKTQKTITNILSQAKEANLLNGKNKNKNKRERKTTLYRVSGFNFCEIKENKI